MPLVSQPVNNPWNISKRDDHTLAKALELCSQGFMEEVHAWKGKPAHYSKARTILKSDGVRRRMICAAVHLNPCVPDQRYKMLTLRKLRHQIHPGDLLKVVDVSDAFFKVPLHPDSRHLFRQIINGRCFQYCSLPQGYKLAMRVLGKYQSPVLKLIAYRCPLVGIHSYADDHALHVSKLESPGDREAKLKQGQEATLILHELLGLCPKSDTSFQRNITYIGANISTTKKVIFSIPKRKAAAIRRDGRKILRTAGPTLHQLAGFRGKVVATNFAVPNWRAHCHYLNTHIATLVDQTGEWKSSSRALLPSLVQEETHWWIQIMEGGPGSRRVMLDARDLPIRQIAMDASLFALGGVTLKTKYSSANRLLTEEEKELHINELELIAVKWFIRADDIRDCLLSLIEDNSTATSYILKRGGRYPHLTAHALDIHAMCFKRNIVIMGVQQTPSRLNYIADSESRLRTWFHGSFQARLAYQMTRIHRTPHRMLRVSMYRKARAVFSTYPGYDLFGARGASLAPDFYTLYPCAESMGYPLRSPLPRHHKFIATPPPSTMGQTLDAISRTRTSGLLVVPVWTLQHWWRRLRNILVAPPMLLNPKKLWRVGSVPWTPSWATAILHVSSKGWRARRSMWTCHRCSLTYKRLGVYRIGQVYVEAGTGLAQSRRTDLRAMAALRNLVNLTSLSLGVTSVSTTSLPATTPTRSRQ